MSAAARDAVPVTTVVTLRPASRQVYFVIACRSPARITEAWRAALGAALGPLPIVVWETLDATAHRSQSPLAERAYATMRAFGHRVEQVGSISAAIAAYRDERGRATACRAEAPGVAPAGNDVVEVWQ